jgi:hypothetical protein
VLIGLDGYDDLLYAIGIDDLRQVAERTQIFELLRDPVLSLSV